MFVYFTQSHNTAPVNWTEFITVYTGCSRSIKQFIESLANLILNYSVFNQVEWRNALKSAGLSMDPSVQTILWLVLVCVCVCVCMHVCICVSTSVLVFLCVFRFYMFIVYLKEHVPLYPLMTTIIHLLVQTLL